jgi:hypothetical protein
VPGAAGAEAVERGSFKGGGSLPVG